MIRYHSRKLPLKIETSPGVSRASLSSSYICPKSEQFRHMLLQLTLSSSTKQKSQALTPNEGLARYLETQDEHSPAAEKTRGCQTMVENY